MTDKEIHSILFRGVVAKLANLRGQEERPLSDGNDELPNDYYLGFERRPDRDFAHNYERDKFLQHRDKYIIVNANGHRFVLLKLSGKQHITIYHKVLDILFGADARLATEKLEKIMGKFYDSVVIEEKSTVDTIDLSMNRHPNHTRVTYEF